MERQVYRDMHDEVTENDIPRMGVIPNKQQTDPLPIPQATANDRGNNRTTVSLPPQNDTAPFADINRLLATGQFHLFIKIGRVFVKIREVHLNEVNTEYLTVLIDDEKDSVWVTVPWYLEYQAYFGKRKFLW